MVLKKTWPSLAYYNNKVTILRKQNWLWPSKSYYANMTIVNDQYLDFENCPILYKMRVVMLSTKYLISIAYKYGICE